MKTKYIITGASSGIGRALAINLLADENTQVVGLSRSCTIEHSRFTHYSIDLGNASEVENFNFSLSGDETEIVLINNAGTLGEVAPLGEQNPEEISRLYQINVVAPTILMNNFLCTVSPFKNRRVIINISSGAANYPIKSWSNYCASKAAINMLSEVVQEENPDIEVYAIAPGVVDTAMQKTIREVDQNKFPDRQRFRDYHAQGELKSADEVARQIVHLLNHAQEIPQTVFSLRDINI